MEESIYIFGAGENGKYLLWYLRREKEYKIEAYIDNDEKKQNTVINGIRCISLNKAILEGAKERPIWISVYNGELIEKQLNALGFRTVFPVGKFWSSLRKNFIPEILEDSDYNRVKPFNHFESPYPDIVEIHRSKEDLFNQEREVLDIDFNITRQLELLMEMQNLDIPRWPQFKSNECRYYYNNTMFGKGSADALSYMIRIVNPKKIVEVGSGYSTAVMLDTSESYGMNFDITCIEPRTERLRKLIRSTDNIGIIEKNLQEIPLNFFEVLNENDILFIDSSHISKINSDVNYVFFEILPRIKKNVYIHFHDISYPFTYPKEWILEGRAYNEMYILRAFLMNNMNYSIQFFGDMLFHKYGIQIPEALRGCGNGSIWIKKEK